MDAVVAFVLAQDPALVILLLMLLAAFENVFPPVPADVATALGAFWAVRAGVSPVLVGLLCFLGNQASAFAIYFWAREKGEAVRRSRAFRSLLPADMQEMVRGYVERFGSAGIFISRFLPGVRAGVLPFAAINGLSPWKALGPATLATLIWYAILTAIGSALGLAYDEVRETVARVTGLLGTVGVILVAIAGWVFWRAHRRRQRRKRDQR